MKKPLVRKAFAMIFVPLVLLASTLLYTNIISLGLFSVIIYWFVAVPTLTHYTAKLFNGQNKNMSAALNGLLIFYAAIALLVHLNYEIDSIRMILISVIPALVMIFLLNSKEVTPEK